LRKGPSANFQLKVVTDEKNEVDRAQSLQLLENLMKDPSRTAVATSL